MKKKEMLAAAALLSAASALCLRLMRHAGERLKKHPAPPAPIAKKH